MCNILFEVMSGQSGVYAILNPIKRKVYVGETNDFNRRLTQHILGIYEGGETENGNENGDKRSNTNKNLCNEEVKEFEIFPVINSDYVKRHYKVKDKVWIAHETIVMYLFREYGFTLYNGSEDYRDNTGKEREFLINPDYKPKEHEKGLSLYELTLNYLRKFDSDGYDFHSWEEVIRYADEELRENIFKHRFKSEPQDFSGLSEKEWRKRLREYNTLENTDIRKITDKNYLKECNGILMTKLSVDDLEDCGLKKIETEEFFRLIENGEFDKVIFSKFGHYLGQSPITILKSKVYDTENNKLSELGLNINDDRADQGVCFWAVKKLNDAWVRQFFTKEVEAKKPYYVIMPYTPSLQYKKNKFVDGIKDINILNPSDKESIEDFSARIRSMFTEDEEFAEDNFAYGYYDFDVKENGKISLKEKKDYPDKMIPAIISKWSKKTKSNSNALLLSDFCYVDASYSNLNEVYHCYQTKLTGGSDSENDFSNSFMMSHCCSELKQDKKQQLLDFLRNNIEKDTDFKTTSFIIAKVEYPYIVRLANE